MNNEKRHEIRQFFPKGAERGERFRVNGIGVDEIMPPGYVNRPAGTGDFLLMFFPQPTEAGTLDGIVTLPAASLMIWSRGGGHYYGCPLEFWGHSWLHCDGQTVGALLRESGLTTGRAWKCQTDLINRYLRLLYAEMSEPDEEILLGLFRLLLLETARLNRESTGDAVSESLRTVKRLIERRYRDPLRLKGLAAAANMSVSNLCAGFRRCFKISPIDYAIELRLREAEHLLSDRNRTLADIAEATGFRDQYYFNRQFAKRRGMSPGNWRKNHGKAC